MLITKLYSYKNLTNWKKNENPINWKGMFTHRKTWMWILKRMSTSSSLILSSSWSVSIYRCTSEPFSTSEFWDTLNGFVSDSFKIERGDRSALLPCLQDSPYLKQWITWSAEQSSMGRLNAHDSNNFFIKSVDKSVHGISYPLQNNSPRRGFQMFGKAMEYDKNAIDVYRTSESRQMLVGHVPIELSSLLNNFLKINESNKLVAKVSEKRKREIGLVVPAKFKVFT